jgi:hypothetical protein
VSKRMAEDIAMVILSHWDTIHVLTMPADMLNEDQKAFLLKVRGQLDVAKLANSPVLDPTGAITMVIGYVSRGVALPARVELSDLGFMHLEPGQRITFLVSLYAIIKYVYPK